MDIYWIGIRESEVKYCNNFIKDSITIYGKDNISMQKKLNKVINHNDIKNFKIMDDFFITEMRRIISYNPKAKFMYYNQMYIYDTIKKMGLLDYQICLNNQQKIKYLSNKFELKRLFKNIVPILDYELLNGKDCTYLNIKDKIRNDSKKYVIQEEFGSGGSGTILMDEQNYNKLDIKQNKMYMITKYCEENIPVNMHILISDSKIQLLPASIQIIEIVDNKMLYKGCDYIAYRDINKEIKDKFEKYTYIVAKYLQQMGYRGICGIDSIVYKDEIYLMEINTRFQNSSTILNKALNENNLPSLQELQLNCFENKNINFERFDVNYSCYIKENGWNRDNIRPGYIDILDNVSNKVKKEYLSYGGSLVYNKRYRTKANINNIVSI